MVMMTVVMAQEMTRKCKGEGRTGSYQTLSPGGGVADGEVANSPGCSGMRLSAEEPGPCMPGGVEEVLRASVAGPLRDTQEVSITRTPMLRDEHITGSHT